MSPVVLDPTGKRHFDQPTRVIGQLFRHRPATAIQNATAWAGAGNGVLAIDLNGTGVIDQPDEINFTLWDPTATSDMQALLDVFDTNHDGKLDAADTDRSKSRPHRHQREWNDLVRDARRSSALPRSIWTSNNHQTVDLPDGWFIDPGRDDLYQGRRYHRHSGRRDVRLRFQRLRR